MKMDQNLQRIFDVEPIDEPIEGVEYTIERYVEPIEEPVEEIIDVTINIEENLDYDYKTTRNNLYALLKQGKDALEASLQIAKASENPRAFEVVGNLIKQLSDINHQLVDLHTKRQTSMAKQPVKQTKETNITNNSIFLGTTASLSEMLSNFKKGE